MKKGIQDIIISKILEKIVVDAGDKYQFHLSKSIKNIISSIMSIATKYAQKNNINTEFIII